MELIYLFLAGVTMFFVLDWYMGKLKKQHLAELKIERERIDMLMTAKAQDDTKMNLLCNFFGIGFDYEDPFGCPMAPNVANVLNTGFIHDILARNGKNETDMHDQRQCLVNLETKLKDYHYDSATVINMSESISELNKELDAMSPVVSHSVESHKELLELTRTVSIIRNVLLKDGDLGAWLRGLEKASEPKPVKAKRVRKTK